MRRRSQRRRVRVGGLDCSEGRCVVEPANDAAIRNISLRQVSSFPAFLPRVCRSAPLVRNRCRPVRRMSSSSNVRFANRSTQSQLAPPSPHPSRLPFGSRTSRSSPLFNNACHTIKNQPTTRSSLPTDSPRTQPACSTDKEEKKKSGRGHQLKALSGSGAGSGTGATSRVVGGHSGGRRSLMSCTEGRRATSHPRRRWVFPHTNGSHIARTSPPRPRRHRRTTPLTFPQLHQFARRSRRTRRSLLLSLPRSILPTLLTLPIANPPRTTPLPPGGHLHHSSLAVTGSTLLLSRRVDGSICRLRRGMTPLRQRQ